MQLTTEQQFQVAAFNMQIQQMTPKQVKHLPVAHYKQMLVNDVEFLKLLGDAWGMG